MTPLLRRLAFTLLLCALTAGLVWCSHHADPRAPACESQAHANSVYQSFEQDHAQTLLSLDAHLDRIEAQLNLLIAHACPASDDKE